MKKRKRSAFGIFLILLMSFFIIACASEPVRVDLPADHPANPHAPETAFAPPPNPFQNNVPVAATEADNSSSVIHQKHQPAHQHQMSSEMDKTGHDHPPSHASDGQNSEHQNKEHNQ